MKKMFLQLNPLRLITQLISVYFMYYLLLTENSAGMSINNIIKYAHSLPLRTHLFVMGVLPIYIGVIIFGTAMFASLIGKWLEEIILRSDKEKSAKTSFTSQI